MSRYRKIWPVKIRSQKIYNHNIDCDLQARLKTVPVVSVRQSHERVGKTDELITFIFGGYYRQLRQGK